MPNFGNADPYNPYGGILGNPVYNQGILGGGNGLPPPPQAPVQQPMGRGLGGFLQNNSDMLMGLGSSLLANPTPAMAMANFGQQAPQMMAAGRKRKALNNWLQAKSGKAKLDPETIALLQSDPEFASKYIAQDMGLTGIGQYGMTPIWGTGADGQPVLMQMSSKGGMTAVPTPPGVTLNDRVNYLDNGTSFTPVTQHGGIAPASGAAPIAKDVSGEAAAKAAGEQVGAAKYILPATLAKAQNALNTIQAVRDDPALSGGLGGTGIGGTGMLAPLTNAIPGTGTFGFQQKVEQLKGQAFLDAYKDLKGGGAITNIEGDKATQAIARLSTAQTEADFKQALNDLEQIIRIGMQRAQAMAGQAPSQDDNADWTDLGNGVRIRPVGQ